MMAEAVNEILSERLAVKIFAVRVDVLARDSVEIDRAAMNCRAGLERGERGILRAENDFVNFALPRA